MKVLIFAHISGILLTTVTKGFTGIASTEVLTSGTEGLATVGSQEVGWRGQVRFTPTRSFARFAFGLYSGRPLLRLALLRAGGVAHLSNIAITLGGVTAEYPLLNI